MSKYSIYTDQELTGLLQADDHDAFTEIYQRYWKKMLGVAWNHSKDAEIAKDLVHEVFYPFGSVVLLSKYKVLALSLPPL